MVNCIPDMAERQFGRVRVRIATQNTDTHAYFVQSESVGQHLQRVHRQECCLPTVRLHPNDRMDTANICSSRKILSVCGVQIHIGWEHNYPKKIQMQHEMCKTNLFSATPSTIVTNSSTFYRRRFPILHLHTLLIHQMHRVESSNSIVNAQNLTRSDCDGARWYYTSNLWHLDGQLFELWMRSWTVEYLGAW